MLKPANAFRRRALVVTWAPHSGRSDGLAQHLGTRNYLVHYLAFQRLWAAPLKYPLQAVTTLRVLWRERPAVVLVQNPPIVAPLVVALYARATGAGFIVDTHSQALFVRRWRWTLPIQRWLSRRALATMVTNESNAAVIRRSRARVVIAVDPPVNTPPLGAREPSPQFNVVVVGSFGRDEPTSEVLQAARQVPDVRFAITGNLADARPEWLKDAPPNVEFTGFVPREDYFSRIWNAGAIVGLSIDKDSVLRASWEALDLGQPLILSDWPILRGYFPRGTVHVANTASAIAAGVREARAREHELRKEMLALREERRSAWVQTLQRLEEVIDASPSARLVQGSRS